MHLRALANEESSLQSYIYINPTQYSIKIYECADKEINIFFNQNYDSQWSIYVKSDKILPNKLGIYERLNNLQIFLLNINEFIGHYKNNTIENLISKKDLYYYRVDNKFHRKDYDGKNLWKFSLVDFHDVISEGFVSSKNDCNFKVNYEIMIFFENQFWLLFGIFLSLVSTLLVFLAFTIYCVYKLCIK